MTDTTRIDGILAAVPADQRAALQHLRETIAGVAPDAVEAMSYGAPAFRYRDHPLVSYAAARSHCAFYVMSPDVIVNHEAVLQGFDASRGTVRLTPDKPLPAELVAKLARARMAEPDERRGSSR